MRLGIVIGTILYLLYYILFLQYYEALYTFLYFTPPDQATVNRISTFCLIIFWLFSFLPIYYELITEDFFISIISLMVIPFILFLSSTADLILSLIAWVFFGLSVVIGLFSGLLDMKFKYKNLLKEIKGKISKIKKEGTKKEGEIIKQLGRSTYLIKRDGEVIIRKCFAERPSYEKKEILRGIGYWLQLSNIPEIPRVRSFDAKNLCIEVDFINGETLREIINKKGRILEKEACKIALKIAEVLERVHQMGFVHRDLKPENIVIRDDNVFIVDWEFIAKEGEEILAIVGSAAYSPKDIGERVSAKQDVYSLGVIINEMVTGSAIATYAGERQSELFKIVNDAIAQKADMKEIRQGLENLLKKDEFFSLKR